MQRAEKISQALFTGKLTELSADEIEEGLSDVPSTNVENDQISLVELLAQTGVAPLKKGSEGVNSERRHFISMMSGIQILRQWSLNWNAWQVNIL